MKRILLAIVLLAAAWPSLATDITPSYTSQWPWTLQSAATTGNGNTLACHSLTYVTCTVTWSSGVTGGAVQLETSDSAAFTGTWAPGVLETTTGTLGVPHGAAAANNLYQWGRCK